jgi:HEAT repeat protein
MTPRRSVEAECARRGQLRVVSGCVDLLEGRETDDNLVFVLAGPAARTVLDGREGRYWFRVWGARGLLYAWDESAAPAVIRATADDSWRVREMAAKVIARHGIGDAIDAVAGLRLDAVARVRAAGERALIVLTDSRASETARQRSGRSPETSYSMIEAAFGATSVPEGPGAARRDER